MSLLGIDIGSGSCKGVVFSNEGRQLASETVSYSTVSPGPSMVETEARLFRDAVFHIIRLLSGQIKNDPVEALCISSHGETIIPVDKNGNAIAPAIMNADNRATLEAEWWQDTFGRERLYQITGVPLHAMFSVNKIIWLRKHKPEIYKQADKFLCVGDYILTQLGLPPYTDHSLATRTMAFDISNCCWSEEILNHCDVPKEKLAIPVAAGTIAGKLPAPIALSLGLKEGTVVTLGGHDQPCGALGAGAINHSDVYDSAGTYECLVAVTDKPMNSSQALKYSLNSYRHVVAGKYVTLAFFPAGVVSSWFTEQFCYEDKLIARQAGKTIYDVLGKKALQLSPGPTGLCITPHFVGSCTPNWDVNARGVMAGLTPGTTRYHIYKALFEGIACELNININALEEITGPFNNINISGGNSRSEFTVQLRADVTGKEIRTLNNDEAVCLGAAMLAGISIGIYKDAQDAVNKVVQIRKTYLPDAQSRKDYEQQLERYKTIHL
jgi:xylulokinase